jgi:hypothetical protein
VFGEMLRVLKMNWEGVSVYGTNQRMHARCGYVEAIPQNWLPIVFVFG